MAEPPAVDGVAARLDDAAVRERLGRLDELLGALEQTPGPIAETALDAVALLAEVYGTALARAVGYSSKSPPVLDALRRDELVGHLLALHQIHPDPVDERVARALDELRPYLHGGDVELAGIADGVAQVRVSASHGCGSSASTLEQAVSAAVLAVAPELTRVEQVAAPPEPAVIPIDALLRRPTRIG